MIFIGDTIREASPQYRFTNRSDEDIVKLIKDKDSEATKKNTKQALDLLKEFCLAKGHKNVKEICSESEKLNFV